VATILVIDDDLQLIHLLELTLRTAGYEVLKATDGQAGLAITQEQHPDLIIADVMMPKLNGYEYCRRVRAQQDLANIPILVFSARFQPIDQQTALQAGATDYMPKTVAPAELLERIDSLLGASPASSSARQGSVVAVFSLRGGAGVTSLAVNLAVALALSRQQPIALLDMAPLSGHVALMLNLRPTGSLRRALRSNHPVNEQSLEPYWQTHDSGVQALTSPLSPSMAGELPASLVQPLATHLRRAYSLALLDLPSRLSGTTATALSEADRILLVVTPDMASVQSAVVAFQALDAVGITERQVEMVLNRPGGVGGLTSEAVAKTLKRPLAAEIPYEPDMVSSLNARRPLILTSPKSAAAQVITRLAKQLVAA
jgi:pilus assembly protein CpaE